MSLLYGKLYKKYFPICDTSIFYEMKKKEYFVLIKWIKNIEADVSYWNLKNYIRAQKQGLRFYIESSIIYSKSIDALYLTLKKTAIFYAG